MAGTAPVIVYVPTRPYPLSIAAITATPASGTEGTVFDFAADVTGGLPPYTYAYSGLPAGCPSADSELIGCLVSAPGTFLVRVNVTDARGATAVGQVELVVGAAASDGGSHGSGPAPLVAWGVVAAAGAGVVFLAFVAARRLRKQRP